MVAESLRDVAGLGVHHHNAVAGGDGELPAVRTEVGARWQSRERDRDGCFDSGEVDDADRETAISDRDPTAVRADREKPVAGDPTSSLPDDVSNTTVGPSRLAYSREPSGQTSARRTRRRAQWGPGSEPLTFRASSFGSPPMPRQRATFADGSNQVSLPVQQRAIRRPSIQCLPPASPPLVGLQAGATPVGQIELCRSSTIAGQALQGPMRR